LPLAQQLLLLPTKQSGKGGTYRVYCACCGGGVGWGLGIKKRGGGAHLYLTLPVLTLFAVTLPAPLPVASSWLLVDVDVVCRRVVVVAVEVMVVPSWWC